MASAAPLSQTLGMESMIDPLITCANLFCWSWTSGVERFNKQWHISAMQSPFHKPAEPQVIGKIWQLRELALRQARRLVANSRFTSALQADYCVLCLGLLALADVTIFGPRSLEYRAHWKALKL
jgi:hypothetical protein